MAKKVAKKATKQTSNKPVKRAVKKPPTKKAATEPADPNSLTKLIDDYLAGPQLLRQAVAGMDHSRLLARPIPGKWSTLEVICHLADFEIVGADRIKRVIAEKEPTLLGGDEKAFAARLAYHERNADEELLLIDTIRSQVARILRTLKPEDFQRRGIHSEAGPLTLEAFIERSTRHIPHHVRFIEEKRKAVEADNVGGNATAGKQLEHTQFRKSGVLSLFLGSFKSEAELDAYLSATFPVDFGFIIDPRDGPEIYVAPNPSCPVADLLKGFSWAAEFVEPVRKALAKDGWHRSGAAVVFYNFCYDPKAYRQFNGFGRLKFMGTYLLKEKAWVPFRNQ
jgi:hypothetical protein